eukprot:6180372-Pleurochrysis_carterae.AAC.1
MKRRAPPDQPPPLHALPAAPQAHARPRWQRRCLVLPLSLSPRPSPPPPPQAPPAARAPRRRRGWCASACVSALAPQRAARGTRPARLAPPSPPRPGCGSPP